MLKLARRPRYRAVLCFLFFFLIIFSYYIAKPIRNSLFLEWMGPTRLPIVYMISAIVCFVAAFGLERVFSRQASRGIISGALVGFSAVFFLFWIGLIEF